MPQEFHIVRCYSCETFQVHIVKKSNKWECKMCGEKQSLKKVYFQGSGKDCRLNVQKLNEKRILNEVNKEIPINPVIETIQIEDIQQQENSENSKWNEYLPQTQESSDEELEQSNYTFNRPNKRKSLTKKSNKNKKIKLETEEAPIAENENILEINNPGPSKWKSFISNFENNPQKIDNSTDNKKSKWNCFVNSDNEDKDEIPDEHETNVSLNRDPKKQSFSNIFSSNDDNLDDVLYL